MDVDFLACLLGVCLGVTIAATTFCLFAVGGLLLCYYLTSGCLTGDGSTFFVTMIGVTVESLLGEAIGLGFLLLRLLDERDSGRLGVKTPACSFAFSML